MPKKNPEDCIHFTVRRVADFWRCVDCGAEFEPKNPKHRTKRQDLISRHIEIYEI